MTAYFDDFQRQLRTFDVQSEYPGQGEDDRIRELEYQLVFDCTVTAQAPEFPAYLRERVHKTILLGAVAFQPLNVPKEHIADFETFAEHVQRLSRLCSDLHTIFHDVARDESTPFYDNPRAWVMSQYAEGENVRERMAAEMSGTTVEAQVAEQLATLKESS